MSSKIPSRLRPALLAATVALVCALPLAAQAAQDMRVVRDPETGQLRAPTAAEARALDKARPQARSAAARSATTATASEATTAAPELRVLPDGSLTVELDESTLMYSVARRNADGSLDRHCVQGSDKADKIMKAGQKNFAKPITSARTARGASYELK